MSQERVVAARSGCHRAQRTRDATVAAATVRVAVTLGCDPDLALGPARLCRLRFADVAFHDDHAVLDTTREGCPEQVIVMALPGDAACLVAALKSLRETRYCAMRADSGSAPPTTRSMRRASSSTAAPANREKCSRASAAAWTV